jgi:hypothetical protein
MFYRCYTAINLASQPGKKASALSRNLFNFHGTVTFLAARLLNCKYQVLRLKLRCFCLYRHLNLSPAILIELVNTETKALKCSLRSLAINPNW